MKQTKVINLFGAPGVGKSTISAGLFYEFKKHGISCELVSEYAKDIVYDDTHILLENQLHVFSEQFRRQYRLLNKVDYIITDSPLLLAIVYYDWFDNKRKGPKLSSTFRYNFREFMRTTFNEFNNLNYYVLDKSDIYDPNGRIHDQIDSKKLDEMIKRELNATSNAYYEYVYREDGVKYIFDKLISIEKEIDARA